MSATTHSIKESPRQAEILDHAMALVRLGGLAALTTKRLAQRVGFTEAALYRHFPNKQALILGMMDRLEGMLLGPIGTIAANERLPILERLERIVLHHSSIVRAHRGLPILLLAEASVSEDAALLERMQSIFRRYITTVEGLIARGQELGEIVHGPEPDCLAMLLLGAPAALAIRSRLLPHPPSEERFAETLLPFLVRSFRGDREEGSPS